MLGEDTGAGGAPEGGYAFLAEHISLRAKRVIKRIRRNHPFYGQLVREAQLLGRLSHPGIPFLYDVEEDSQYLYLIEEYIEGISLKNLVLSEERGEYQIIPVLLQICAIIQYLHQQNPPVYYLDLKPEHLILRDGKIWLLDYGAAGQTLHLGTVGYAAPELREGGRIGAKTDVYGIGCVAYFLLTGAVCPENGRKGVKYGGDIRTRGLWKIIKNCLHPSIQRRPELSGVISSLEKLNRKGGSAKKLLSGEALKGMFRGRFDVAAAATAGGRRIGMGQKVPAGGRVIGVLGTHPGAGATFISIQLSCYLSKASGRSVAWLEYNSHGDGGRLTDEWKDEAGCAGYGQVDFFPDVTADILARSLNDGYEYYVIDFGCEWEECATEYLRCGDKIVVAQTSEWKLWELERFREIAEEVFREDSWHYLYNLCPKGVGEQQDIPGISFPWEPDVRRPSSNAARIFGSLFR